MSTSLVLNKRKKKMDKKVFGMRGLSRTVDAIDMQRRSFYWESRDPCSSSRRPKGSRREQACACVLQIVSMMCLQQMDGLSFHQRDRLGWRVPSNRSAVRKVSCLLTRLASSRPRSVHVPLTSRARRAVPQQSGGTGERTNLKAFICHLYSLYIIMNLC